MPSPGKNETQQKFVSRCIPIVLGDKTAKDQKQAAAICYSIWREKKKELMSLYLMIAERLIADGVDNPSG